nr:MAG TPA: hypothetical protein [Caudoviricetes sp.]
MLYLIYYIVFDIFYPRNSILQFLADWPQRKFKNSIHEII